MANSFPGRVETDRLTLVRVARHDHLETAFRMISERDIQQNLEFPANLSFAQFRRGLHSLPARLAYLIKEKSSLRWVGQVIVWTPDARSGNWQILYCLQHHGRGQGYAREACRAILERWFRDGTAQGFQAVCKAWNVPSLRVLRALGMDLVPGSAIEYALSREAFYRGMGKSADGAQAGVAS